MIKIPLQAKFIIVMIFVSLTFISQLKADYLLGNLERCTTNYYYYYDTTASKYYLRYFNPRTDQWNKTTSNVGFIESGWTYDYSLERCTKDDYLGLSSNQYNFLYSIIGILIGLLLFWIVPSSKK